MKTPLPPQGTAADKGPEGPLFFERFHLLGKDIFLSAVFRLARARSISIHLVGGMVRNVLLNEPLGHDYDFLCSGETAALAGDVAEELGGSAFVLDIENGLYRVALKVREALITLDFLPLRFPCLEDDLLERDFTVNAMALPLEVLFNATPPSPPPSSALIDPLGGRRDCEKKILSLVSARALAQDPLRCLRAVRLGERYALTIDKPTLGLIKKHAPLIETKPVSRERVRDELSLIFTAPRTSEAIAMLIELGLMSVTMPRLKSVTGPDFLLKPPDALKTLDEAERLMSEIESGSFSCCSHEFSSYFKHSSAMPSALLTLKMGAFFHDLLIGARRLNIERDPSEDARRLTLILKDMVLGNKTVRALTGTLCALERFSKMPPAVCERPVVMGLFFDKLIESAGPVVPVFLVLALAEARACKEAAFAERLSLLMTMSRYYFHDYLSAPSLPFFTGEEIMSVFNLSEGERVGAVKAMIEEALLQGVVRDKAECAAYIKKRIYERWG